MKKWLACMFTVLFWMCSSTAVCAGSVPEDLLHSDGAQVFFARVIAYKGSGETAYMNVMPVKVVKGDVALCEEAVYKSPCPIGDFKIQEGKAYLFTYFDENNPTYVLRASSYDTDSLHLIDIEDGNGMWERFESNLNAGEYEKAEADRRTRLNLDEQEWQASGELPPLHLENGHNIGVWICVVGGIGAVVWIVFLVCKRKRKKR